MNPSAENKEQALEAKSFDSVMRKYKKRSQMGEIVRRFVQNKGAMLGLIIILIVVFIAVFADQLLDYDTQVIGTNVPERMQGPSAKHLFGTDELGRDIFYRVLYGSRISLAVGVVSVLIGLFIGLVLGCIAGYFGGMTEEIILRLTDILAAVPNILMGIVIVAVLGASTFNLMLAIGITSIPQFVRVSRAAVLTVRGEEYVEAARSLGRSEAKIIALHIVPNCLSPIIVQTTLRIATAIIQASSLSFLGLGVPVPSPEWGALLSAGRKWVRKAPYMTLFPGLAIMITVLAFNMIGDGLRDAMDPKLRR